MEDHNTRERGQAIVLLVFAVIALLGFTALAIDGGMVYSDRRHAQNAADAASLAGGGVAGLAMENNRIWYDSFDCSSSSISDARDAAVTAATSRANNNGYTTGLTVTTACEDGSGSTSIYPDKYIAVTTTISRTTRTNFIHFVYQGPVNQEVAAVTLVRPRQPLAFGNAVVALNDQVACDDNSKEGVVLSGSGETSIDGGGIWSNGCLKGTNNSCDVEVTNGSIRYAGGRFPASGAMCESMVPSATYVNEVLPGEAYSVPEPDCGHTNAINVAQITSGMVLAPGRLYCVTATNNAVKITNGSLIGHGVTIYMVNGGDIEISGGEIDLSAPGAIPDPWPALPGILFYVNPDYQSVVNLNGNGTTSFLGTIYAPSADVSISGANDTWPTFNTQVIGWNVEVSGNASVDVNYNDNWNYSRPSWLNLEE